TDSDDDEDNDTDTDTYATRRLSLRSRPLLPAIFKILRLRLGDTCDSHGCGPPRASGDEALPPTWCRGTLNIIYTPVAATASTHYGSPILIPPPFRHLNGRPSR
ncbi:hypothetical protein V496_06695, partial [Pseudogymnoascus sp. VKM F-4515 (FW-2607)]